MSCFGHIVYMKNTYTRDENATNINPHNLDMFCNLCNLVFYTCKTPPPNNHQRSKNTMETSQANNPLQSKKMVDNKTKKQSNRI